MFGMSGSPESFESWTCGSRATCELPRHPHRYEVRLRPQGARWEIRSDGGDVAVVHDREDLALVHACECARRAYADAGRPSCVKALRDGTWETIEVFGLMAPLGTH